MKDFDIFIILAELILDSKNEDAVKFARQNLMKLAKMYPELNQRVLPIIKKNKGAEITKSLRFAKQPLPVDQDSRLELIKTTISSKVLPETRWPENVQNILDETIREREFEEKLVKAGLKPITSVLFVGPPGVGKTLAAAWLALMLNKPFYVLDLSAVMSSYLGRTGNNIRTVLDFAKSQSAVLLLDEFDAIAKRRDDGGEIGELKRLVTVLLQEIDEWPNDGLLIAATNHEELLDPAVWRRFDRTIAFPYPSYDDILKFLQSNLLEKLNDENTLVLLSILFKGNTYAEIDKEINTLRKKSILSDTYFSDILDSYVESSLESMNKSDKSEMKDYAYNLIDLGFSQRKVSDITGLSRPTVKKIVESKL